MFTKYAISLDELEFPLLSSSGVASSISEGDIFIYSCSAQLISFEIESISKEINCVEYEYMNMSPLLIELATPLLSSNVDLIIYWPSLKASCQQLTLFTFLRHGPDFNF